MTVIDIIFATFAFLILGGAAISAIFILAVIGVTLKRRKEGKRLPWMCLIRNGECLYPERSCTECPIWMREIGRELERKADDEKQKQRGIPGSDSERSDLSGRRKPD